MPIDDLGTFVALSRAPRRVVSLVPSLTEAIAASAPDVLVGATDWCSHPADLDVPRVRGTKNPDLAAIARLRPDLVVANREENRELDVRRLRQAGLPVWVTVIESLAQALDSMDRLFAEALAAPRPKWLAQARQAWSSPVLCGDDEGPVVVVPIWRDPWMVVGSRTFTGDVLTRLGARNAFGLAADRYPHVDLAEIDRPDIDLALLPDEPYRFTPSDGPEAFQHVQPRLVSGRLLTWYGPSLLGAREHLLKALTV
ncbi:helical backbone metal receptor [Kineosporia rhizophila]|uniref:helical backbone metal receptor n=1 Tax=Kineosporia TaxID=49184 RepID=UPI001E583499|nr:MULTISPECIES: helical backbone metal receptor [Kineosporia]MCE0538653.1 helical backbone metal receptor [Kineosporia rhizophila]GLY20090.1 ABC transporter substrate-binding protein [Kineosporia sp. NBRC 101677]